MAAGLARQCQIQISYTIGRAEPNSISVDTFGTSTLSEEAILRLIIQHFNFTPQGIIDTLDLQRPIFAQTVNYGHFGRENEKFTWEELSLAKVFQ